MKTIELWIDYIDPASWIMHRRIRAAARPGGELSTYALRVLGREIRPPSAPPLDPDSAAWHRYVASIREVADEEMADYGRQQVLPHTRKAHELAIHAAERDSRPEVDSAIFHAALVDGQDVGRVDVLVGLAEAVGLDRTETRAVLDVDRYTDVVVRMRDAATSQGVVGVPTMVCDGRALEGVRTLDETVAWLDGPPESN